MHRLRAAGAAVVFLSAAAPGCTKPVDATPHRTTVRVSSSASVAPLVHALSLQPDLSVQSVRVSGSPAVIEALRRGEIDVGLATADVAYLAFVGELNGAAPFQNLRGIAVVGLNTLHLIARRDTQVKSVSELKGLTIGLGSTSGTALVATLLLEASGVGIDEVKRDPVPYPEAAGRLAEGKLAAAFMTVVPPAEPVVTAAGAGARLVEIEGPAVERLRLQHPFLVNTTIPRGTYPGQLTPIRTIGVDLLLVGRADLDDELVSRVMDVYFSALGRSTLAIDFDRAPATSIPLHPAAARYYRQRELSR
jgi:TRAP transporter TAXI family solute receptor